MEQNFTNFVDNREKVNCEFPTILMSCRNFQKQSCQLRENNIMIHKVLY